jgi:hypothetical protein
MPIFAHKPLAASLPFTPDTTRGREPNMMRSLCKQLPLLLVAGLACAGVAYAEPAGDEAGVRKWLADTEMAWNRKQEPARVRAKALVAVTAPDFTMNGFLSNDPSSTRAQAEVHFTRDFTGDFKTATVKFTLLSAHFLKPDVAFVDVDADISRATGPDGKPYDEKQRVAGTVVKKGGKWLMTDARVYPFPR